jgi:MFS family permease
LVLFALEVLHTGNVGYGLLLATAAVAAVAAAMTTNRVTRHIGAGTVMIGGHIAAGVAAVAVALTSNAFLCAGALAIVFACNAWGDVVRFSLRQELTPDVLRGRVYSLIRTAMWGVWPIGALVGGLLAEWSLRAPFLLFAGVSVAVGVIAAPFLGNRAVARARAHAHAEEIDMHGDEDVDVPLTDAQRGPAGDDQIGVPGATSGQGH